MPLPVIANVARVAVEGHAANGHQWANIWHLQKPSAMTWSTFATDITAPFSKAYGTGTAPLGWGHYMGTGSGTDDIRVTPLDGTSATIVVSLSLGASATAPLPQNVALVLTIRTGTRGRSFRGRIYLANPITQLDDGTGKVSSSDVANILTIWNQLETDLAASSIFIGVASYKLVTWTAMQTLTMDTRFDTQRRRLNT